eukprot:252115-Rhodomonas_salina.4
MLSVTESPRADMSAAVSAVCERACVRCRVCVLCCCHAALAQHDDAVRARVRAPNRRCEASA